MFALYDTNTKQYLQADGGWVWANEYTAKCKFNAYVRYSLDDSKAAPFSKQSRVVIRQVSFVAVKEMDSLLDDARWRCCVEGAGVDNWSGYDYAMEEYHSEGDH